MSIMEAGYQDHGKSMWFKRSLILVLAVVLGLAFYSPIAFATPFGSRSITLGSAHPSVTTNHDYSLTINSGVSVGSISMEYCQESPLFGYVCSAPTGLDLSGAVLSSQTGEVGFSIHGSSTSSMIILTRVPSVVVPGVSTYSLTNIVNPSAPNTSSFVRVASYASTDGSGARIDEGGLAFSITRPLSVQAYVPPFIIMCSGLSVAIDCSSASGSSINLGELSSSAVNASTSQFSIATNDDTGYNVYILGTTMTSGTNTISANVAQAISLPGTSQFGLNLVANTNPTLGSTPSGSGTGVVNNLYDDQNLFRFQPNDLICTSSLPTNFNRFTITYIVNIPASQAPGVYASTMSVLGVADF